MTARGVQRSGALMHEIGTGEASLVLTSPPYFPDELEAVLADYRQIRGREDSMEQQILEFSARLRPVYAECARVLADDGALVLQVRDVRLGRRLVAVEATHRLHAESEGFHLYARHEWRPTSVALDRQREMRSAVRRGMPRPVDAEAFLVFARGDPHPGEPTEADLELLSSPTLCTARGQLAAPHRHQSPVPVLEALVRCYSKPGELVVDPFVGGGTCLKVADALGRRAFGYDIDAASLELLERNLSS
jgi:DNA modification methylase